MPSMFRTYTDDNGVEISCNSHPIENLTHPAAAQRPAHSHWMAGQDGREGYMEPAAESLVHMTKDRVLGHLGRPGAMTFEGDLLPRSDRVPREQASQGIEKHAPGCWCSECPPPMQTAAPAAPAKTYRK